MRISILLLFASLALYGVQDAHVGHNHGHDHDHKHEVKKSAKKINFVKLEGTRMKHNSLTNPERIMPFVHQKYNSTILKGGQMFSKLKVSESHMNIKDKDKKNYVFDVHAQKNVGCAKCHISEPNKTNKATAYIGRLNYLIDKGSIDNYFNKQHAGMKAFKVKNCVDCHEADIDKHKEWLPATSNHMEKVSCETCHINQRDMFTAKSFNYAVLSDKNEPFISYIGLEGKQITGFTPNNLWYKSAGEKHIKIKPANMVSFLVWMDGEHVVDANILKKSFYQNGQLHPKVRDVFDKNKDGKLSTEEAKFDKDTKKELAKKLLKANGVKNPKLKLMAIPVALQHNVMPKEMATKSCVSCHSPKAKSELYKSSELLDYAPTKDVDVIIPGVKEVKLAQELNGKIVLNKNKLPKEHVMMVTDTSSPWIDKIALLLFIATLLGLLGHGLLRIMFASKRK